MLFSSVQNSSRGLPTKEFFLNLKSSIKINKRNTNLRSRFFKNATITDEDYDSALLKALENSYKKHCKQKYHSYQSDEDKNAVKLDSGSSFILFILRKKHFRDAVPDIELAKYKQVCCDMISKLSNCHEAHFGLARLLTNEGHYDQAEQHLNIALSEEKNLEMYNTWLAVLKSLSSESKQRAMSSKKFCECNK